MKKAKQFGVMLCAIFTISTLLISCGTKSVEYKTAEKNTTQENITKELDSEPNETKEENGMTINTYKKSVYMDYTGTMDYYYLDDKLMMSRWETECDDEDDTKTTYEAICANVTKELGKGTESDTKDSYTWTTDEKDITVGYVTEEDTYTVYIFENQH